MTKKHKKWFWIGGAALAVGTIAVLAVLFWPRNNINLPAEGKVAVVNGVEISSKSFNHELRPLLEGISEQENKPNEAQLLNIKKKILEKLIVNELLYQESQKEGIQIGDAEVDKRVDGLKRKYDGESAFKKDLAKLGLTEADLTLQMRKEMMIQQYVYKKFVENLTVTEKELADYYEKYGKEKIKQNLKQIKAQQELNDYVDKLKAGAAVESFLSFEK